jgi:Holliday junction resolvase
MTNRAKQKGTSFETSIKRYLNNNGFLKASRTVLKGSEDTGDINGIRNNLAERELAIQCKNQRKLNLSGWLDATVEQAAKLGKALPALVVKRAGKGEKAIGDTYVVMRLDDFVTLLKEGGYS